MSATAPTNREETLKIEQTAHTVPNIAHVVPKMEAVAGRDGAGNASLLRTPPPAGSPLGSCSLSSSPSLVSVVSTPAAAAPEIAAAAPEMAATAPEIGLVPNIDANEDEAGAAEFVHEREAREGEEEEEFFDIADDESEFFDAASALGSVCELEV